MPNLYEHRISSEDNVIILYSLYNGVVDGRDQSFAGLKLSLILI